MRDWFSIKWEIKLHCPFLFLKQLCFPLPFLRVSHFRRTLHSTNQKQICFESLWDLPCQCGLGCRLSFGWHRLVASVFISFLYKWLCHWDLNGPMLIKQFVWQVLIHINIFRPGKPSSVEQHWVSLISAQVENESLGLWFMAAILVCGLGSSCGRTGNTTVNEDLWTIYSFLNDSFKKTTWFAAMNQSMHWLLKFSPHTSPKIPHTVPSLHILMNIKLISHLLFSFRRHKLKP